MNFVYITTNLINGKQYVGSHFTDNLNDGYTGSGKAITSAIKKYGKENFKREILEECNTIEEARKLEEPYIIKFNTCSPNGYNILKTGGLGIVGKTWGNHTNKTKIHLRKKLKEIYKDESLRKRISDSVTGSNNGFYNKKHTESTKKKISEKNKGKKRTKEHIQKIIEANSKPKSEEHKRKISNSKKGIKPWNTGKKLKPRSEETKRKISESLKRRNAK